MYSFLKFLLSLSVSQKFLTHEEWRKIEKIVKNRLFHQNFQKSTNVAFFQKFHYRSLILLLMLRQSWRKRHLINLPPPPQNGPFGGGGKIFGYFHEFLGLEHKKNFGKTLGQSRCFGIIIGRFRPLLAILWLREIQNIWDFHYFWANLATFFFKIQFWPKLVLEPL